MLGGPFCHCGFPEIRSIPPVKSKASKRKIPTRLLGKQPLITPNPWRVAHLIPDEAPRFLSAFPFSEKAALLAKIRHNRLVGDFLGFAAHSLETNVRSCGERSGQVLTDEIYFGVDRSGRQFVVPVQAKGGNDKLSAVQARQDIVCCTEKFPGLICRAISAQFMEGDLIALFELTLEDGAVKVVDETHYRLVPADQISREELAAYAKRKG